MNSTLLRFGMVAVWVCAALLALPAVAQDIDLPEIYTFDSGVAFNFPEGGEIEADENNSNFLSVIFDDATVYVADFPVFEEQDFSADSELIDAAQWYIENISETEFDADAAEAIEVDGREALKYSYTVEDEDWLLVLVRFEDGTFAAVDAGGADEDTVLAIATSLSAGEVEASGGADCTVSAAAEGTVQLRVGPGENRTSFAFMPANTEFAPLGQAETDDGSLWFQLDKAEVAPQSAAAEAWVAADAVNTSGDCDALGESSAPPIVPIIPAAPPTTSGGGDSGSSGGSTGGGDSGSTGGGSIAPAAGTWTISYASNSKASCLDIQTIDVPINWAPDIVSLSLSGNTLNLGGNRLAQTQPNVYSGLIDLGGGESAQVILRTVSTTQFSGEVIYNFRIEDHQCSGTVPISVTKN